MIRIGIKTYKVWFTKQDNTTGNTFKVIYYNTQEGKKIQVGSGKVRTFYWMDEIANQISKVCNTIEPALLSDLGTMRCSPILAFTGGETEKAGDAKNLVEKSYTWNSIYKLRE